MSDAGPSTRMSDADFRSFVRTMVIGTVLMGVLLSALSAFGRALLFGWFLFLDRSLATFQPDGLTLWIGIAAFAMLFAVVHRTGRRAPSWTWRSTMAVCLGISLLFAASVAMVASLHQLIWLAGNSQSTTQHPSRWSRPAGPLSVITQVRQSKWRQRSAYNLRWFILRMQINEDQLPPGSIIGVDGTVERGWAANSLLGYYTAENYDWYSKKWDDPEVADTGKGAVIDFMHPELGWHGQFDDRGFALMHYAGNVHVFPNNRGMKMSEITDGTSNTLGIGEVAENFQPWASPWNRRDPADGINDVPWGFGGPPWQHGAQFGLMDGAVRFLSKNIDRQVLKALGTPAGGEQIPADVPR